MRRPAQRVTWSISVKYRACSSLISRWVAKKRM
jgi:hypothetical protein